MKVPFLDLQVQYQIMKTQLESAMQSVLDSSVYIGGDEVSKFERAFAEYTGARHAIGVGNGTDALFLSLWAAGIGPGDEVITAANTFVATVEAIAAVGAKVILVDADPESYTIDVSAIERAITPQTKAIIPVHLYGQPADMTAVVETARRFNLVVIEDACQAHGATFGGKRVGTIGNIGCFSFYPGKNLGAYGDAGAIVTDDDELANRIRHLQSHGSITKYVHEIAGWNSRLDSIQAAVLNVKLAHLDEWNELRSKHALAYQERLAGLPLRIPEIVNESHVWHLFVIEANKRDEMAAYLAERGVATGIHYPAPVHLTRAFAGLSYPEGSFPIAEAKAREILSLPMFPELTIDQIEHVTESIRLFVVSEGLVK